MVGQIKTLRVHVFCERFDPKGKWYIKKSILCKIENKITLEVSAKLCFRVLSISYDFPKKHCNTIDHIPK